MLTTRRRPTRRHPIAAAVVAALIATIIAAPSVGQSPPAAPPADHACMECHGRAELGSMSARDRGLMVTGEAPAESTPDAPRPGLTLRAGAVPGSVHAELRCVDCHRDALTLPHRRELAPVACNGACHEAARDDFLTSIHAAALERGDPQAPRCQTCHGGHDIVPRTDRRSTVYPLNAARICGDCHQQHTAPTSNGDDPGDLVGQYLDSVHGRAVSDAGLPLAATCSDCHGHHDVRAAGDPLARTDRARIPETCGACHVGVAEQYAESVHGRALTNGSALAPVCTDCHAGHRISHASTPTAHLDIVTECGDCHDRPELSGDRRSSFYRTYRRSYHGQVTALGSARGARCSDCHGAHDVRDLDDPDSRLRGDKLVETCRSCHPGANANFARFDPHADYRDGERYPVLAAVWWYFVVVMSLAFGFFGLHSILWFARSVIERIRNGPGPPRPRPAFAIRRFTKLQRINHVLVIVSFLGLVLTGIPLLFAERPWAKGLAAVLGGIHQAGIWHRTLAVLLIINFAIHFYGIARSAGRRRSWRDWLFGPGSMLPRWKDLRDCVGMFGWFFRGGRMPAFGRWTYWEKFDYWAEIGGSLIIGGSGLLLWFPEFFARFMPGWIFNVAMIVHGYEALLALGFIFSIHFFNAHLRLEKFPVDDVIFTGSLDEDELKHERPEEYRQLVESGELESLRVPAAPDWQRRIAVIVGIVAMVIGTTLVALIILAGIGLLRNGG